MILSQQKEEVCLLYRSDHCVNDIALKFNINRRVIYHILKEYNIISRTATLNDDNKKNLIKKYMSGCSALNVAKTYNINIKTVYNILKKYSINYRHGTRKYFFNERFFNKFSVESCYWAGFLAADGNVYKNSIGVGLQKRDAQHLAKFLSAIGGNQPISPKPKNIVGITVCSKLMATDLKNNFNIYPNKSMTITMPKLPKSLIRHYIRGYFDGDGTICWNKSRLQLCFSITSGSAGQINDLCNAIDMCLNIKCNVCTYDNRRHIIRKGSSYAEKIFVWLYKDINDLALNRKKNKFYSFLKTKKAYRQDKIQKRIFTARNNEILKLKNNGAAIKSIAKTFNLSESGCYYVLSLMRIDEIIRPAEIVRQNSKRT